MHKKYGTCTKKIFFSFQNTTFNPNIPHRKCTTPPTVTLRAPHWYEVSLDNISQSAPNEAGPDQDFRVSFKNTANIETAEDAVSLSDVLIECRRLRKKEEEVRHPDVGGHGNKKKELASGSTVGGESPKNTEKSVRPKEKNQNPWKLWKKEK